MINLFSIRIGRIIFLLTFLIALGIAHGDAKKVTTKLKPPKPVKEQTDTRSQRENYEGEEIENVRNKVTFLAYDKKASSSKETFFIKNDSGVYLYNLKVEISYFNTSGNLIHKRIVDFISNCPENETRKIDIPSWDTQKSFHYVNSMAASKGSTPYTVKFRILSFNSK